MAAEGENVVDGRKWVSYFHSKDISLPLVRRRAGDVLLDLMAAYGKIVLTRGRCLTWNNSFPSRQAYHNAVRRLRRDGLIAYRRRGDGEPVLILTDEGNALRRITLHPDRRWRKKWNGIWYVLVYDVPEARRDVRKSLQGFLKRLRMGLLQRSVWVSPFDIRPEYQDLVDSVSIEVVSYLFESRTVLFRPSADVVRDAWSWDRLRKIQGWYLEVFGENLRTLEGQHDARVLQAMAREELSAYLSAMEEDPLLPGELLPPFYRGKRVFDLHKEFAAQVKSFLRKGK